MAAASDVLTCESWDGATMTKVATTAFAPFRIEGDRRIAIRGPEVVLTSRLAMAFFMAFHELATNAVKYGALTGEDGRILRDWDILDGARPDGLPPTRRSFGSRMIERAPSDELDGNAEIDYRSDGIVFTAETKLPNARRQDDGPIFS